MFFPRNKAAVQVNESATGFLQLLEPAGILPASDGVAD
jgi:hypothetical protein